MTWTPPADCVAGLTLPGRDPDDVDLDALHQLIIFDNLALTAAAQRLNVSVEHVRHALQRLHRAPSPHPKNTPPAARRLRERATDVLTLDFFQREYIDAGKDLRTIASGTGIHRKLLARHARRLGVRLADDYRGTRIDPRWLREQAETLQPQTATSPPNSG